MKPLNPWYVAMAIGSAFLLLLWIVGSLSHEGHFGRFPRRTPRQWLRELLVNMPGTLIILAVIGFGNFLVYGSVRFEELVKRTDHAAVARAAVALIAETRADPLTSGLSNYTVRLTHLPPVIADLRPRRVDVGPDTLQIACDAGFEYFGLDIARGAATWEMSWYRIGKRGQRHHRRILDLPIDKTNAANPAAEAVGAKDTPQHGG